MRFSGFRNCFSLAKALVYGLVPLVYGSQEPDVTLKGYISLYLREEVQAEGLVYQHLRAWCDYTGEQNLFFWRTPAGTEVDFVVYGQSALR